MLQKSRFIFILSLLLSVCNNTFGQNQAILEKEAATLYQKKEYIDALPAYRQLLAKDQLNPNFNFRYGHCLFEVADQNDAAKYFDLILANHLPADPLVYYYRARIYQHQYFFSKALSAYQQYEKLTAEQKNAFDVTALKQQCQRGIAEFKNFQTLPFLATKEVDFNKFYAKYPFSEEGYSIYEAADVLPKYNVKKGYVPIYCYRRAMKYRIVAAYDGSAQLDLYIQKKDAANNWANLIKIQGAVNTNADEAFGFYDEETQTLYYSSTANSIGGYDLFKAQLDLKTGMSSEPTRLTYPFSSPDDDFLYVVDRVQDKIFFASNRAGLANRCEIYSLAMGQTAQQPFVFSGKFSNQLNNTQNNATFTFIDLSTHTQFGPFMSEADGSYLVVLPSSGSFQLNIQLEGTSTAYQTSFVIPVLKEQEQLKQQVLYEVTELGKEKYTVINSIIPADLENQVELLAQAQVKLRSKELKQTQFARPMDLNERSPLLDRFAWPNSDTLSLLNRITDSLLAAEVSLENQVRLTEVLRKEFEQKLAQRETLISRGASIELEQINSELAFIKNWLTINQAANIPNLQILNQIQQTNEKLSVWQHVAQQDSILNYFEALDQQLLSYLQIAAFDGERAIHLEQQKAELDLQQLVKSAQTEKQNIARIQSQIRSQEKSLDLQSKKEQSATQLKIEQLKKQLDIAQTTLEELEQQQAIQEKYLATFELDVLKEIYLARSERQDLPSMDLSVSMEELLSQYEQQEVLLKELASVSNKEEVVKNEVVSNQEVISNEEIQNNEVVVSNQEVISNQENPIKEESLSNKEGEEKNEIVSNQEVISNEEIQNKKEVLSNEVNPIKEEIVSNQENQIKEESLSNNEKEEKNEVVSNQEVISNEENQNNEVVISNQENLIKEESLSNQENQIKEESLSNNEKEEKNEVVSNQEVISNEENQNKKEVLSNEVNPIKEEIVSNQENQIKEESLSNNGKEEKNEVVLNQEVISNEGNQIKEESLSNKKGEEKNEVVLNQEVISNEGIQNKEEVISNQENLIKEESLSNNEKEEKNEVVLNQEVISNEGIQNNEEIISNEELISNEGNPIKEESLSNKEGEEKNEVVLNQEVISNEGISNKDLISNEEKLRALGNAANQLKEDQGGLISIDIPTFALKKENLAALENELNLPVAYKQSETELASEQWQPYLYYLEQRDAMEQFKERISLMNKEIKDVELALLQTPSEELGNQLLVKVQAQQAAIAALKQLHAKILAVENQPEFEALLEVGYLPPYELITSSSSSSSSYSSSSSSSSSASSTSTSTSTPTSTPLANPVFEINKQPNTASIPIGLPCPQGLVFRVQVGAFRKPIPAGKFTEFSPVDGRVLANGLTVVMAGYFSSSAEALKQRNVIRGLGYADAFIVAYNGCERMSYANAVQLEAAKLPNGKVLPKSSIFETPGEALYYTVQVGVYNRPLQSEKQLGLPELIEAQTAKGQYRYASGRFDKLTAAKERQRLAVAKGITDAFIVAYYQGKRISLAEAKQLVAQGVTMDTKSTKPAIQEPKPTSLPLAKIPVLPVKKQLRAVDQFVRYEISCTDCAEKLAGLNRFGVFTYVVGSDKISSPQLKAEELTTLQRYYFENMKVNAKALQGPFTTIAITEQEINGAQMDWLLRQGSLYLIAQPKNGEILISVEIE